MSALSSAMTAAVGFLASCVTDVGTPIAFKVADATVVKAVFADRREAAKLDLAAAELTNAIFRTTGRLAPIYADRATPSGAKVEIHLGPTAAAKAAKLGGDWLRNGDWRVVCKEGRAFLFGKTAFAATRAAFDFMANICDYHVLTVDGDDVFTRDPCRVAKVCDVTTRPAIYGHLVYHGMYDVEKCPTTKRAWERYALALGSDIPRTIEGMFRVSSRTRDCHSSFDYLPPDKWFREHPEYYSMGPDGRRHGIPNAQSQLCYTNPDTYRLVLESLERFVAADRQEFPDDPPLVYDFTQQDNSDFLCLCPECRRVIAKYDRKPGGHVDGGDAGLQLEFVNRLARDIRKKYPDVQIRTFAYVSSERAPMLDKIAIEPNVRIWWCDVYSHSDHTIPLRTPGHFNERQARELDEWLAFTKNIEVWDYMLYRAEFPEISPDAIKADAAYYSRSGIPLLFMESEYCGQPLYELNFYLMSRLYVDPTLDVASLMKTFCRSYGEGADDMYAALDCLRRAIVSSPAQSASAWHSRVLPWLTDPTPVRKFAAKVKRAYDKTSPGPAKSRLARVLASACLHLVMVYKKDPSAAVLCAQAQKAYRRYAVETARTAFMEPGDRAGAEALVDETLELITLRFKDLPDELADVSSDELVCVDYHATSSRRGVPDHLSERGCAVAARDFGRLPVACGVYDHQSKDSVQFLITAERLKPGAYAWVKLGKCHIGHDSIFWFPGSWRSNIVLKDFHVLSDGMEADPNWYELWVSAREGDGMFLVDRLAFRRVLQ